LDGDAPRQGPRWGQTSRQGAASGPHRAGRARNAGAAAPGQGRARGRLRRHRTGARQGHRWGPDRGRARGPGRGTRWAEQGRRRGPDWGAGGGAGRGASWAGLGAHGGEAGKRERGREGKLTSGLDDRRQLLTGIPPRARGGGREGEGSCCAGKEKCVREKGWGRSWGGGR
jgi:hypothetical protein